MIRIEIRRVAAITAGAALALTALVGCAGGAASDGTVEITYLTQNDEQSIESAEKVVAAFMKKYPDIKVTHNSQPAGTEGDNLMKTKLSTGEMEDVFIYNTGSLMQALRPDENLVDLSDESWMSDVTDDFKSTVETDKGLYAAPIGTSFAGGILYNKPLYDELGLSVPTSWDEFMSNSEVIKAQRPDVTPILQAYGDDWTAQIFVLASYASVQQEDPEWATDYTENKVHYSEDPAIAGFQHQQDAFDAGMFNPDFASLTNDQALKVLAEGGAAQYPILTNAMGGIAQNNPDELNSIGYFAMPADDSEYTAATVWQPAGLYIPTTTTGAQLDAAKKLIDFIVASPESCAISNETGVPGGPYVIDTCELTGDVPTAVQDLQAYFDDGRTAPALEFLSPIKGPALPAITVQVGSGISTAKEGAALYDEDVKKQAQQLGLEGW